MMSHRAQREQRKAKGLRGTLFSRGSTATMLGERLCQNYIGVQAFRKLWELEKKE